MKKMRGKKGLGILITAVVLAGMTFYPAYASTLDDLYRQRDELQREQQRYQDAAGNKAKEAKTIAAQITQIEADIKRTEAEIQVTTGLVTEVSARLDQLNRDIEAKNAELVILKQKLNSAIVEIYRSSSRSDWELLFGFNSLSDAINQTKYVESVESQAKSYHDQTLQVKNALDARKSEAEARKAELDQLKSQQEAYRKSSLSQVAYKDRLLNLTESQRKEYEAQAEKIRREIAQVSNEIYKKRQGGRSGENLGGGSGYPYSCDNVDPWGFYTCQCTSYAAWYWNEVLGRHWERGDGPAGTGDAKNWPNLAARNGVGVHSNPQVGAIISWSGDDVYIPSTYGHVAIVEGINGDGTIDISEYNWVRLSFSRRRIDPGWYGSYSYIY